MLIGSFWLLKAVFQSVLARILILKGQSLTRMLELVTMSRFFLILLPHAFSLLCCFQINVTRVCFSMEILQIINSDNVQEAARETEGYFIKSGIVTVIKDALIPSGTVI